MLFGYRMTRNDDKAFQTTIAPGAKPSNFNMDVDSSDFHCPFGQVHEGFLCETAKQRNVNHTGTLRDCQGCFIAKGRAKPISTTRNTSSYARWPCFCSCLWGKECAVDRGEEVHAHDSR